MSLRRVLFIIIATLGFVACEKPNYGTTSDTTIASLGTPANNEIWFTTTDNSDLISFDEYAFDAGVISIESSDFGHSVIVFDKELSSIGNEAFAGCHNLYNISLPHSVTTIGEKAFSDCINMECMTLGGKLASCGTKAFDFCVNLYTLHIFSIKSWCNINFASPTANPSYYSQMLIVNGEKITQLHIPEGITEISPYAFYNNSLLQEITMPASVQNVGKQAFAGCDNISKVATNNIESWCGINFADESANPLATAGVLYTNGAIVCNLVITSAEEIKSRTFIRCTSLKSIKTEDATKTIALEAFRGCTSLTDITLGYNTAAIEARVFTGCTALKSVTCLATEPPALGADVFMYNADNRKIRVPRESVTTYQSATNWSEYANDIEEIK